MRVKHSPWQQLVYAIAWWTRLPEKRVEHVLRLFGDEVIKAAAAGRDVRWPNVGTFSRATRKARRVRNPVTKELMQLQESTTVQFRAAKAAKARVR